MEDCVAFHVMGDSIPVSDDGQSCLLHQVMSGSVPLVRLWTVLFPTSEMGDSLPCIPG